MAGESLKGAMDKGEEGKRHSLWKEGITAQSHPLIISGERYFDGVANAPRVGSGRLYQETRLECCHVSKSLSEASLPRCLFKTNG